MSANITVGYVLREQDGAERFSQAYFAVSAGVEHKFCVINKSFNFQQESPNVNKLVYSANYILHISDYGLALRAHYKALLACDTEFYCGLNSWSRPLKDNWLKKLLDTASIRNVGLVSCTGSYETFANKSTGNLFRRFFRWLLWIKYPNPHLRLTGFCGRVDLLLNYWPTVFFNKSLDEYHEHGCNSISRKMLRDNLDLLVVSSEKAYNINKWPQSKTYRSGNQEHLLVADKQTDLYVKQHCNAIS